MSKTIRTLGLSPCVSYQFACDTYPVDVEIPDGFRCGHFSPLKKGDKYLSPDPAFPGVLTAHADSTVPYIVLIELPKPKPKEYRMVLVEENGLPKDGDYLLGSPAYTNPAILLRTPQPRFRKVEVGTVLT